MPLMFPHRLAKHAVLALAIAGVYPAVANEEIRIPGLNMPVAASTVQQAAPTAPAQEASRISPAREESASAPAPAPAQPAAKAEEKPAPRVVHVAPGSADNPAVPASVVATPKPKPATPVETRQDVVVSSGTNTLIPISKGHINRLVTPFENPIIQTVSGEQISKRGNVIYVTTESDQPVTMFVTPDDDETVAISLTLLPQAIPPIQANLIFAKSVQGLASGAAGAGAAGYVPAGQAYSGQAKKWERSQPYMDTMRSIMRELALGQLPKGYSMNALGNGAHIPACAQPNLSFDFSGSQLIEGHDFRIFVAVAENVSAKTQELDHGACTHPHRAAVSSWPNEILEPGEKTEVFVVTRVPREIPQGSIRPSLLQ